MARVVFAPDSFKGSASALEAARALADGWHLERPGDELRVLPMADGGEGTLDAFEAAVPGAERRPVEVTGPDGRRIESHWLWLPGSGETGSGGVGVVELAATSGLTLLDELRAQDAQTTGFGEAIAAALDAGVQRLVLAIGGSSSTDAGAGALGALGARFLDAADRPVRPGNRGLADAVSADFSGVRPLPPGGVQVVSDVTSPLFGPAGAAHVFGAQKGADAAVRSVMDENLRRFAALIPVDPWTPGAGAAGGTGFGLLAWGASARPQLPAPDGETARVALVAGALAVSDAMGLADAMRSADAVVTGEGRFDEQSRVGKVPAHVAEVAATETAGRAEVFLAAGSIQASTTGFTSSADLSVLAGSVDAAIASPLPYLREAGALLARSYRA